MKFGSLFSGIGGFDLGLEQAGMQCAWQVEIDLACQKLLGVRFPNAKRYTDVREQGRNTLDPVDLVCGGFPCQDLSVAGKRKGLAGERSGLWFAFHRILAETKPSWVVIENVPGLLSSNKGRDFAIILRGLVELGYGVCWRILDARYFGVAQRRRRVFIVASLDSGRAAEVLFESEGVSRDIAESEETRQGIAKTFTIRTGSEGGGKGYLELEEGAMTLGGQPQWVAGTLSANRGGLDRPAGNANELDFCIPIANTIRVGGGTERPESSMGNVVPIAFDYCLQGSERTQIARTGGEYDQLQATRPDAIAWQQNTRDEVRMINGDGQIVGALSSQAGMKQQNYVGVRRLTPVECERLQGFPDNWTDGFADSTRYRMLGNAVCVPVARWLAKRIIEVDSK